MLARHTLSAGNMAQAGAWGRGAADAGATGATRLAVRATRASAPTAPPAPNLMRIELIGSSRPPAGRPELPRPALSKGPAQPRRSSRKAADEVARAQCSQTAPVIVPAQRVRTTTWQAACREHDDTLHWPITPMMLTRRSMH